MKLNNVIRCLIETKWYDNASVSSNSWYALLLKVTQKSWSLSIKFVKHDLNIIRD